jgi:hypothetical protein
MVRFWITSRGSRREWRTRLPLFTVALLLCVSILGITVYEKFLDGGWVTVTVTGVVIGLCFLIRRHYRASARTVDQLYRELGDLGTSPMEPPPEELPTGSGPVAAVLVDNFGGVGIHTVLNVFRAFPHHYKGLVFCTVGVVDSGEFKGEHAVEHLRKRTSAMLQRYRALAAGLKIPSATRMTIGTDVVAAAEELCVEVAREFPGATFFAGKLIFRRPRWWHGLLHNETARAIQERLQWRGKTMVTLPIRVRDGVGTLPDAVLAFSGVEAPPGR